MPPKTRSNSTATAAAKKKKPAHADVVIPSLTTMALTGTSSSRSLTHPGPSAFSYNDFFGVVTAHSVYLIPEKSKS